MFRYLLSAAVIIGAPLGALILHYTPLNTDKVLKTPIIDYALNGDIIRYNVALNDIHMADLVGPLRGHVKQVNIYLRAGPDDTAYPYLITPRSDKPKDHLSEDGFFITGDIISISDAKYNIRYNIETIALPKTITAALSNTNRQAVKAVWHVRINGTSRLAGFEINGKFMPYQFSLNSALLGLTQ